MNSNLLQEFKKIDPVMEYFSFVISNQSTLRFPGKSLQLKEYQSFLTTGVIDKQSIQFSEGKPFPVINLPLEFESFLHSIVSKFYDNPDLYFEEREKKKTE